MTDAEKKREKKREAVQQWRSKNRERAREINRKWRAANKAKVNSAARKRYADNPDKYREVARKRYSANPVRGRDAVRRYREANPAKAREAVRKCRAANYGVDLDTYDFILSQPCAGCGAPSEHLDHCHVTGKVRAGLCRGCNLALGHVNDSSETLIALAQYVIAHSTAAEAA